MKKERIADPHTAAVRTRGAARFGRRMGYFLLAVAAVSIALVLLDRLLPPPLGEGLAYSREILDRRGERLRLFTTPGGYWRLPAVVREVDPRFVSMLLAYEDRRFREHAGVDPLALARALGQALWHGRIVSGGSTLTMQTVRLLEPRPRTLGAKLAEILRAWQLERRLDKERILGLYLGLAPYGGNLQGVRAASLFYFGKEPRFLTLAESALLVALPQSPERRRPDRFPDRALQARNRVLSRLAAAGVVSVEDAGRAKGQPLPDRRGPTPRLAPHLGERLRAALPRHQSVRTTLDSRLQRRLETLLARHQRLRPAGETLAALIVENGSGAVRAYAGSGDYLGSAFPGQVDMVRAVRSPGSALKPFIYGLGFQAGIIHPETLIADRPGPVDGYAPGNFDHAYRGEMRVREALRSSRNLPAVKVLSRVGPQRLVRTLARGGVRLQLPSGVRRPGLPIALGGAGISLEDLVRLYSALAGGGRMVGLHAVGSGRPEAAVQLLSPAAAWYLTDILADSPRPAGFVPGRRELAFKTGTSYGFRDAWAIGYDAAHTAGVWVGRPDGGYTAGLSGLGTAVPVLLELFDLLPDTGLAPLLNERPAGVLTLADGELPAVLRRFRDAEAGAVAAAGPGGPRIVYPTGDSLVEVAADAAVLVEGRGGEPPFHWLVDGRHLRSGAVGRRLEWRPQRGGAARITLLDRRGRADSVAVEVRMLPPESGYTGDGPAEAVAPGGSGADAATEGVRNRS